MEVLIDFSLGLPLMLLFTLCILADEGSELDWIAGWTFQSTVHQASPAVADLSVHFSLDPVFQTVQQRRDPQEAPACSC